MRSSIKLALMEILTVGFVMRSGLRVTRLLCIGRDIDIRGNLKLDKDVNLKFHGKRINSANIGKSQAEKIALCRTKRTLTIRSRIRLLTTKKRRVRRKPNYFIERLFRVLHGLRGEGVHFCLFDCPRSPGWTSI